MKLGNPTLISRLLILSLLILASGLVHATPVGLDNGQGWIFKHNGNCYLLVPQHVANNKRELNFFTADPVVRGDARLLRNFQSVHDLAIAYVNPGMQSRCTSSYSSIPSDISRHLQIGRTALLTEVRNSGLADSLQGKIAGFDTDTIIFKPDVADTLFSGRSGGSLIQDETFIGMAIQARESSEGTFLRADEIRDELRGLFGRANSRPLAHLESTEPSANSCNLPSPIAFSSVRCSAQPLPGGAICSGILTGQSVQFAADSLPVSIDLAFDLEGSVALAKVQHVSSDTRTDESTAPKSLLALIDQTRGDVRRWRRFGAKDADPEGNLTIENGSRPNARHLRLIIKSAWQDNMPIEVGCIRAN